MVTFNGHSFDLPVLRYRAMIHGISAPGLHSRSYYHRFTEDHIDSCDVLSSYNFGGKAKLDEISRVMSLPGKPHGMDGSQVEAYYEAGSAWGATKCASFSSVAPTAAGASARHASADVPNRISRRVLMVPSAMDMPAFRRSPCLNSVQDVSGGR